MRMQRRDGSFFQMEIVGYEFPEMDAQEGDSNWLNVRIEVGLPQGTWTAIEPSLLTKEAERLAAWLESVAEQSETESSIGFIEPNFMFELVQPSGGARYLRIWFGSEYRPPWNHPTGLGGDQEHADFVLGEIDLYQAAESLRSQLRLYPQRSEF